MHRLWFREIYCQDYYYMYLRNFKTLLFDSVKPVIYVKPKSVIGSKGNVYQLLEIFPPKKLTSGTKFFSWPFCTWNIAPILLAKMWQQQLCGGRVCLKFMAVALCKFLWIRPGLLLEKFFQPLCCEFVLGWHHWSWLDGTLDTRRIARVRENLL